MAVSGALDTLRRESARLRRGAGPLSVVAEASFANRWLAPRLSRFCERYPDIDIRIAPHPEHPSLGPDADIIVRRDMPPAPGLFLLSLPKERLFPVLGPGYLHDRRDDWQNDRLLRSPQSGREAWLAWFRAAGLTSALRCGPMFQFTYMALAAAAEGRGTALAGALLVTEDLRAGRLAALRSPSLAVHRRYTAACPEETADSPRVRVFFDWMREELARDTAEFPDCFSAADPE